MPYVSLIVPTMRCGGLDILMDSLHRQSFTDFELVLVDGLYEYRKDRVTQEARDRFLRCVHVGLTPNPFPNCAFCAYSNAGIRASSGEVLLFMVDYSRLPSDLIGVHAAFHKADTTKHKGLMCPHRYTHLFVDEGFPRYARNEIDKYEGDVKSGNLNSYMWSVGYASDTPSDPHQADGGATVSAGADPKLRMNAGRIDPCFFHGKNESAHRDRVLEINGWDQELDGAHLYQDSDFADRLSIKAGVEWYLDPAHPVDIVNPRHVFPFARRLRPHESNREIWQSKKEAGYPDRGRPLHTIPVENASKPPVSAPNKIPVRTRMRIAMIYGEFASAIHGPFDIEGLYTRVGLTGSESSFFNLARTLAEHAHSVVVFCVSEKVYELPNGLVVMPIQAIQNLSRLQVDAVIAWNEPDYLRYAPIGVPRFVAQQLNDWGYVRDQNWQSMVDHFVFPSESSRQHHIRDEGLTKAGTHGSVIANSVDPDLFAGPAPKREAHRVVYCSSPDRGLHHLLGMWPAIRARIPDAELKIFYRLAPWLARVRDQDSVVGKRARYIEEAMPKLQKLGVHVVDLVPNAQMATELRSAKCLAYPCDPVSYTEGFGVSVLDACAAGCMPIVSNADAFPEVHGKAATVIDGKPVGEVQAAWVDIIIRTLELPETPAKWAREMANHAQVHSRMGIASQWEALLSQHINQGVQLAQYGQNPREDMQRGTV